MALGFCGERDLRVVDIERMVGTGEQGHHLEREEPWAEGPRSLCFRSQGRSSCWKGGSG